MKTATVRIAFFRLLCASVSVWFVALAAADWPVFRGNALQTGVADGMLPDQLDVLWKFTTKDSIDSTPAVAGGVVYVGSEDKFLYALELTTGKEKWKYQAGEIKAPVGVSGGCVFAGNLDGVFHCVDAATGQKRWTYEAEAEISSGPNFTASAVLFGSGDEQMHAVSKDGKPLWKFKVPGGPVMGTPAIVGDRTFAAGCDSSLHVIDTATGKETGTAVDLGGQVGAAVAVGGDRLYVGTMGNQVLAIDWKKGQIVWQFEADKRQQPFYASAALTDKLVIIGGRDKRVYALARDTGKEIWSFPTGGRVDSSAVVVGQRVFVGSLDGSFYMLDVANGNPLKKWELDGPISGSPAVADGCIVVGTNKGTVYCFGTKK
jgi:outer membrane protein assembly factor BamB